MRITTEESMLPEIAAKAGFIGKIGKWDGKGAKESLKVILEATQGGQIRLDCWCMPKKCHAVVLGDLLRRNA